MKQSTFSAVMANSIKNLLQGYTKGIRLIAVLTLLLTVGIGQVWGAEVTLTNDDITNLGTTQWAYGDTGKTITGEDGSTWTFDGTYHGSKVEYLQLGQKSGKIHIPTVDGSITKITINAKGSANGRYLQIEDSEGNHIGDSKLATATQQDYTFNITDQYSQLNIVNHNSSGAYSTSNNAIFIYSITVTYEEVAAASWMLKGSFDNWGNGVIASESGGIATATYELPAMTQIDFKFEYNGSWYGNNGAIITDISGWEFSTSASNARLFTGPAGTYTFKINTSNKQVQVIYPTVTHPAEGYAYFQKQDSWSGFKVYNYTSDNNRLSDWDGSPSVTNTTTICGKTYYYTALATQFTNVIFRDNDSNQWKEIAVSGFSGKYCGDDYNASTQTWKTFSTYSITFNANGGSGSMATISGICPGESPTLPANTFTAPAHHSFDGWATSANGSKAYNNNATISNITSNINLYARWKADTYTITSTLTNCSSSPAIPTSYTYTGSAANLTYTISPSAGYRLPDNITVSGTTYTWDKSTGKLTLTGTITSNVTITITAVQVHSINWVVNGAAYDNGGSAEALHNSTYQDLTLPTAPGDNALDACYPEKVFVGWSTTDVGYTETDTKPTLLAEAPTTPITANTTFYAVFATVTESDGGTTTVEASVTIADYADANGWDSGTQYESVKIDENITATAVKTSGSTSNTGKYYESGEDWRLYQTESPTLTISAAEGCTITTVTVTYSISNTGILTYNGSNISSNTATTINATSATFGVGNTGTATNGQVRITKIIVAYTMSGGGSTTETTGYVTKCYCVTEIALSMTGGHQNLDVEATNQLLVTYTPDDATCGKEIALWTSSNDNVISVDSEGLVTANMAGTATITATTTNGISNNYNITVNNPACDAWYLHYWNASITGDECFYKVKPDDDSDHEWRTNNFSLPSNSDEDQFIVLNANGVDAYQADKIFRTGIGFADIQRGGRNCDSNPYPGQDAWGQLSIYDDSESTNRHIAFYPAQYMVTFGKDGDTWVELPLTNTTGYEYESEPFTVPNGYKTDDTYKYWVGITNRDGDIHFVDGKSSVDAMNGVNGLSADDMAGKSGVWHIYSNSCANNWYGEFIRYYRVDFDLNGGEGEIASRYGKTSEPYVTFSTSDITPPTRDGYTFLGWEDQKGTTYNPTESTVTINDDLTLTAQWAQNHTLTYDLAGGDGTACDAATTYYTGQSFTVCSGAGEKTGYTFNGWLGSDGNTYNAGGTYTMPDEDLTITAQWTRDTYTITWNVAGEETTTTIGTGDPVVLPAETPTSCSDTYTTFVGWYTAASGMETSPSATPQGTQVTASTVPEGNVTYYAVWANGSGEGGWEKVTSISDVNVNAEYIIGAAQSSTDNTMWYLSSYNDGEVNTDVKWGKMSTDIDEAIKYNLSSSSSNLIVYDATNNCYLTYIAKGFQISSTETSVIYNEDDFGIYASNGTTTYNLRHNYNSGSGGLRWYDGTTGTMAYFFKAASSATGYISSCCNDPAEVTLTPAATTIYLDADGTAKTTIEASQVGGTSGSWQSASVSRVSGSSEVPTVTRSGTTYTVTATGVGVYNITIGYKETCVKSASVQITVKENPCQLTATGDVHLTSGYTGTAGVAVYTTTAAGNNITVAASNLVTEATKLRVKYLDANGDAIATKSNSRFRLCDATAYTVADNSNIAISGSTFSGTYSVSYTPSDYGTGSGEATDTHTLVFEAVNDGGTRVFARCSLQVYGRSLPEEFVIGAQYNGEWFALPADLPTSVANGYASAVDAYPLEVNDAKTSATLAPANARYKVAARNTNDHRGGVRLTAVEQGGYLQAPNSQEENITYLWLPTTNSADHQDWYLTSTDFASYKIQLDPALKYTRFMNMYGGTIGWFANANVGLYLLPITEDQCIAFAEPTLSATYQTTTATVTITPPKFGRIPDTYEYSTDQENWTEVTGTTFTVSNLVEGTPYIYYVRGKLTSGTNCSLPASINLACPYIVQPSNVIYYGTTGNAINEVITITSVNVQNLTATSSNGNIVVALSGSSLTISLSAANATEGTHTTTVTLAGDNVNPKTFTVTIIISDLATQAFEWGDEYAGADNDKLCLDQISEETLYLSFVNTLYDEAHAPIVDITNIGTKTFTDLTTGTNIDFTYNGQSIQFEKAALTIGHKYRFAFENEGTLAYSQEGIPYIDCSITFTATNCSTPTATDPCKVTNSGFTANWIEDDDNCLNLNVYTKKAGIIAWEKTFGAFTPGTSNVADWYITDGSSVTEVPAYMQMGSGSKGCTLYGPATTGMTGTCILSIVTAQYNQNTDATISITYQNAEGTYKYLTASIGENTWILQDGVYEGCRFKLTSYEDDGRIYLVSASLQVSGETPSVSGYPKQVCNATSYEVTGLSANTQYYYTVSDASNTSNEIAVTTLEEAPTVVFEFDLGAANLQAEGACVSEEVVLNGENLPACQLSDISFTITGTDAALFSYETNNLVLIPATGELTGTVTIIYCPEDNLGNHSALLTATIGDTETTLQLIGTNCPTGFSTMATDATNITATSATANWTHATTGYVMFSTNGKVNTNLLLNPGFELGTKEGWNELEKLSTTISTKSKKSGTYSLFVPQSQSSFLVTSTKKAGPVFANKLTLAPGEYTITANVQGAETDASATAYLEGEFYLGFYNGSKVVYCSEEISSTSNKNWQTITANFTITSEITAYPFVAHTNSAGAFFLDDVSLICTSATMGENAIEYPITDATSLDLTGLQPSTSYSYYVVNEYGCESNIITFTTESSDAVPTLSAEDVEIIGPVGKTTNGTFFITATNAYAAIVLTNGCNNSPITLATATVPQTGGVVSFSFTPNETHEVIGSGTCTISMITTGMTNPATVNIHWTVAAGEDPNTPIVEVTDITNTSLTIEHNQTTDPNTEVHIVISRETTDEEAGKNLGDEIFFSKYYEAYSHKKLWAIYNPTDRPISLANTYVWRSNGDGDAWSIDIGMDLSQMGNIEPGYIYPNEELIVYTADQVGACEHEKADMSNWVAMSSSDRALSFSGDDALLLVRQDILDSTDDDPTTESQEKEKDENGVDIDDTNKELSWRRYHDEETDTYWWMLDIIGARKNNNTPDNSATKNWTCATTGDKGDAEGWVGAQGDDIAGKYPNTYTLSTNRCLLIRKMTVKSGNNATLENVGDMYTLNTEWRGAHVPYSDDQEETSCENFSFVGGYDYDGYYNAWTSLMDIDATEATRNDDGSYTADGIEVPRFYCHPLRIEVYITETINGEEIDNVKAYIDYKVPIVVDKDITTADQIYFKYPERTDAATEPDFVTSNERSENILDDEICAECDVVIRDGAKLTHIEDGRAEFRTMQVYPTAKFEIPAGLNMQLAGLHMYAKNDEVGYAIINNDGSSIHAEDIIHIKRIDDMYWYPFSLPYDCKVSSIYQLNGKSMGEYWVDWGIKYYDGEARQKEGDNYAGGATSKFWKKLGASDTLKAHQGYIIGLFTTEWQGQMKSIYFPPVENKEYTEGGNDAKTTYISNWSDNLTCEPRHRGWNFTGLPYISLFSSQNGDGTTNNNSLMMGSQTDDYATSSIVYVSIPDGGNSRTYTQVSAASVKLEPFKPYFVQAMDPTDGQSHNDITLTYSKGGRTLEKMPARAASSVRPTIVVEMRIANADASLVDNAGVLVNERYTANYEIAADLTKMYAADRKPQLFTRAANNNEMLAYNALPDPLAQNIPLGIYLPNNDEYTISIINYASQLSDAEAVYLLHNGEIVANLLYADYTIPTQQAGLINGYSLDIRRRQDTPTNIDNIADGGPVITVVDGQIVIQQLPEDAQLYITDVLGRVLYQQANVPHIITFQAPVTGVYNVVITTTEQQFTHKTIIR